MTAFFDIRITHVNSKCNQNKSTATIFKEHESEKKRIKSECLHDVEMGTFTPLILSTGMRIECHMFLKHLADKLSRKDGETYHAVISWYRTRLSFEILRSVNICVRGSRRPFKNANDFEDDFNVNANAAEIF